MWLFSRGEHKKNSDNKEIKKIKSLFASKKVRKIEKLKDYSTYSKIELYREFKSDNWKKLSHDDKLALVQEVEKRNAVEHNRPVAKVIENNEKGKYGGYSIANHIIKVDLNSNSYEVLDTIFHESEHANQSRSLNDYVDFSHDDKMLMLVETAKTTNGRDYYEQYKDSLYNVMTSELDANNVAINEMASLKNEFQEDDAYIKYLESRKAYYKLVANEIISKKEIKKEALLSTIESAYIRGEFSEKEFSELRNNIENKVDYDGCEIKALEMNIALQEYDFNKNRFNLEDFDINKVSNTRKIESNSLKNCIDANKTNDQVITRYQTIDSSNIQRIDNTRENFWNHHGNTKEDYIALASNLAEVQKELAEGKTLDQIKENPKLHDCAVAYYGDDKMIKVEQNIDGTYSFQDETSNKNETNIDYERQNVIENEYNLANQNTENIEQSEENEHNEEAESEETTEVEEETVEEAESEETTEVEEETVEEAESEETTEVEEETVEGAESEETTEVEEEAESEEDIEENSVMLEELDSMQVEDSMQEETSQMVTDLDDTYDIGSYDTGSYDMDIGDIGSIDINDIGSCDLGAEM